MADDKSDNTPNWLEVAAGSALTPQEAAQEASRAELEDSGVAVIRSFAALRTRLRRLIEDQDREGG